MNGQCSLEMCTKRQLVQAQFGKRKYDDCPQSMSESVLDETCESDCSSPKNYDHIQALFTKKSICVWCMKGRSKKQDHKNKLLLLQTKDAC